MKGISSKAQETVMGIGLLTIWTQTVIVMKVSTKMIRRMALEYINGKTAQLTKESFWMIWSMEKEQSATETDERPIFNGFKALFCLGRL